jgi:hypothetical protein
MITINEAKYCPKKERDLKDNFFNSILAIRITLDSLKRCAETFLLNNGAHLSDVIFKI